MMPNKIDREIAEPDEIKGAYLNGVAAERERCGNLERKIEQLRNIARRLRSRLVSICQNNDLMTDEDAEAIAEADEVLAECG